MVKVENDDVEVVELLTSMKNGRFKKSLNWGDYDAGVG